MKKWKSHKTVEAARIEEVQMHHPGPELPAEAVLVLADGERVTVSRQYLAKHQPEAGGYFVRYEDGYESFSPATSFERGYTPVED